MKLAYLNQDCKLTLKEGLQLHYSVDPSYKNNLDLVPAFYNHDIVHVLFGLKTTVDNESLADTRCIFGTNWGFKNYLFDYLQNPDALKIVLQIFKEIGFIKGVLLSIKSMPNIIRVLIDCKKMTKKWELNPCDELLNTKLSDLRKTYNISVIN